jgi:cytochrome P450
VPPTERQPRVQRRSAGHAVSYVAQSDMRTTFFPFGQGIRNCIGEGFAWTESTLLLSVIAAHWELRLADGAAVHPVVSSALVPSELPIIVARRR